MKRVSALHEFCLHPAIAVIVFRQIGQPGTVELFHVDLVELYEKGGRTDLVEKEKAELDLISRYLPEQLSEEQISAVIADTIRSLNLTSDKYIGRLMGAVMPKLKGQADGKIVQQLARSALMQLTQ